MKVVIPVQPLLSLKFLETRKCGNTKRLPFEIFPHCETKKFWRKNMTHHPYLHLLSIKILDARIFMKHRRIHYGTFWHCETKNFPWEILILLFFLSKFFFAAGKNLQHSTEGVLYAMFRYSKAKHFRRQIVNTTRPPFLIPNMLRYPKVVTQ